MHRMYTYVQEEARNHAVRLGRNIFQDYTNDMSSIFAMSRVAGAATYRRSPPVSVKNQLPYPLYRFAQIYGCFIAAILQEDLILIDVYQSHLNDLGANEVSLLIKKEIQAVLDRGAPHASLYQAYVGWQQANFEEKIPCHSN